MKDATNERKVEHIDIIRRDADVDRQKCYFDEIRLKHRALPELDLAKIDTSTAFLGRKLSFPLLISGMTGGDHDLVRTINVNLAKAAEATGVAMGVGSQRVMFAKPSARKSFELRAFAPNALLFANLGAVQLNYGLTLDHCKDAVAVLQADALCLHLNPLQEAMQPEGNTNFSGLAEKIGHVAKHLGKPVIAKEIGSGLSVEDAELLVKQGVKILDVAGSGGTSWSRVEHHRRGADPADEIGMAFQDWGIPTPRAIADLAPLRDRVTLIASGGIRSGIDMAKALALGASLCGLASPFLQPAMESHEAVIAAIERLRKEFRTAMFLSGVAGVNRLEGNFSLIADGGRGV
ncbi:MAG: type 2 isopentenyl-diphosphate Delta-isomerase [bacterium]